MLLSILSSSVEKEEGGVVVDVPSTLDDDSGPLAFSSEKSN